MSVSAPLRIEKPKAQTRGAAISESGNDFNAYLDRLTKMIPAPVITLYIAGVGQIPKDQAVALLVWAVICLVGVIALIAYGTADPQTNRQPDWMHTLFSALAFGLWVYNIPGGYFTASNLQIPWIGSLAVLLYTFFIPLFYKGQ
jgi:hypothetical protein